MPLQAGVRLGPYEVLSLIGMGGMGEVYKASDTRLNRTVAIKVLPRHLSDNPEMKQRFEREAQTIAALSHPHICALYDVGETSNPESRAPNPDTIQFLVMEYLEGETLAQRLARGALPLEEALRAAIEMADALDKAHRQGVVHRDLKPSNVMLTKSGSKLLDFGLAKLKQQSEQPAAVSALPTRANLTGHGTILGTLQYMAPEQLEGKDADARADIFAFGAVLYEMVTGQKAFEGKSQASLIGAILKDTPKPVSALQPVAPPALDHLIATCLEKDPENRWQTARDVWRELRWIAEGRTEVGMPAHVAAPHRKSQGLARVLRAIATLLVIALAVPAVLYLRGPQEAEEMRFLVSVPSMVNPAALTVSPDGRWVAFVAAASARTTALFIRPIDSVTPRQVGGTEGEPLIGPAGTGTGPTGTPFWSPDSRYIAFVVGRRLKKVDVRGGPPQDLCELSNFQGGTWNNEGVIVFGSNTGVHRVSATGGAPAVITALDSSQQETAHTAPHFLPDGRHYLYSTVSWQGSSAIYVGSLDSKERKRLFVAQSKAIYAEPGYLLFHREGTLFAQPFDANRLELMGEPVRIAVISFPALDQKRQISTNGGEQPRWRRDGKELYYLAADGKLMAVDITADAKIDSGTPRELFDTELTLSPLNDQYRVTPDGQRFLVLKPVTEATPTPITVVLNWQSGLAARETR